MIRPAEARDIPAMVRMGGEFLAHAYPDMPADTAYLDGSCRNMVTCPMHLALVLDIDGEAVGMLCAAASRSPWVPVAVAVEQALWIDPARRGGMAVLRMIRAYVEWARGVGCVYAILTALPGRSLDRLYARAGFKPHEFNYMRRI